MPTLPYQPDACFACFQALACYYARNSGNPLLIEAPKVDWTTSDHNLQDPYCRHCHTYTDELPLLDLSGDSIGPGSCELDCVMA